MPLGNLAMVMRKWRPPRRSPSERNIETVKGQNEMILPSKCLRPTKAVLETQGRGQTRANKDRQTESPLSRAMRLGHREGRAESGSLNSQPASLLKKVILGLKGSMGAQLRRHRSLRSKKIGRKTITSNESMAPNEVVGG